MKMALLVSTRKHERYATKLKVKINSGGLSFWAITSDISKKGLRIRVNQEFPVNMVLHLDLIMPDGHVSFIKGVVRYVKETHQSKRRFGLGIEIIDDDATFRDYLKELEAKTVLESNQETNNAYQLQDNKDNEERISKKKDVMENTTYMLLPSATEKVFDHGITEQTQDMKYDVPADIALKESDIIQPSPSIPGKSREHISEEGNKEELIGCASITGKSAMSSESKWNNCRDKKIKFLPKFIILLLAIGIVASGIFLYRNLKQDQIIQQVDNLICSIQVGAFKSEANAQILSQRYKEKGHDVFIDKSAIKDKGIMYRVLIGSYKNLEDASHLAMDIREKENIDAFVICK
jgi:hypothetical protein